MDKTKRILVILMSMALVIAMAACGSGSVPQAQETTPQETQQTTTAQETQPATTQAAETTVQETQQATTQETQPAATQVQETTVQETQKATIKPTAQPTQPAPTQARNVELTVSAAASLKDAMEEIKTAYAKEKSTVTITYNFGASGSLQQQIEQGAAVDLFLSAAAKQMDALQTKGLLLEDTRKDLLENKLVLIIPNDSAVAISDYNGLTDANIKKIALGEPKSVPAGQYAEEVLTKLGLLDTLKEKFVYGKDVRTVLTWVETGDADAGVVYETDAKISDKVKVVAVAPEGSHTPIIYPASVLKDSKNLDAARDFINYLYSDKAKPIFEKYGFTFLAK